MYVVQGTSRHCAGGEHGVVVWWIRTYDEGAPADEAVARELGADGGLEDEPYLRAACMRMSLSLRQTNGRVKMSRKRQRWSEAKLSGMRHATA